MEDLLNRYYAMHEGGFEKLRSGTFPLWTGVLASDSPNLFLAAVLDASAETFLAFSSEISAAATDHGVGLYLAGRDFPLHVTIQQGRPGAEVQPLLDFSARYSELTEDEWEFRHFTIGPNLLLCGAVPPDLPLIRKEVSLALTEADYESIPIDICHATVARVTSFETVTGLEDFAAALLPLRQRVAEEGLMLPIERLYQGEVGSFLSPLR